MASKLYVGGLAYSTTSEGLREFFTQCGNVLSATVITDRFSGQSRGFGFVEMNTAEEAQTSISQLNGRELDGRRITVEISNPQAARTGGGGGGGRESGYAHRPSKPVKWEKRRQLIAAWAANTTGVSRRADPRVVFTRPRKSARSARTRARRP